MIRNSKIVLSFIFILMLSGCQVNHVLLPRKFSAEKSEFISKKGGDNLQLNISGDNLQPSFFKNDEQISQTFSVTSYYFETESGRKINGWLLRSKTQDPVISVFALHGNSGNLNSQYERFTELTKYGFQVFIFDYAGFGFSEGKSTRKNAIEDSFAAFDFFKALSETENTPKIIYGQSIGGNFSIPVATENQESIEGLIVEGTFTNFKNIGNRKVPLLGKWVIADNYDNQVNLKNFKKPILVVHSSEDRLIPLEMGQQLFDNANEPKEFFEIERPHIAGITFYAKEIAEKIYKMIQ